MSGICKLTSGGATFWIVLLLALSPRAVRAAEPRVERDLQVLYRFDRPSGEVVQDLAEAGGQLDLKVETPDRVRWRDGALDIQSAARIATPSAATSLVDAVRRSGELTIEAWVRPRDRKQDGPARLVTLSHNTVQRNFTLGQDGDRYDVRLRTRSTSTNGLPSVATPKGSLRTDLTHVVYTRDRSGEARIFIDGKRRASGKVGGNLSNWDGDYRLAVANELTGDRPWLGELHLVAVYSRALSQGEVRRNFAAGAAKPGRVEPGVVAESKPAPSSGEDRRKDASRQGDTSARVHRGLRVLYTFESGGGNAVRDRSGVGTPIHLEIDKPGAVRWHSGFLEVHRAPRIRSSKPVTKVLAAVKRTHALTIEAWIRPANDDQSGPARLVSISADTSQRNVTLGQDGHRFDVRLRAGSTDSNGMPSLSSPARSLRPELTHVVYTRSASGEAKIYIDGKERAEKKVGGKLDNWNDGFELSLANELSGDRPWLGELHLVAIYSEALTGDEIARNFAAGSDYRAPPQEVVRRELRELGVPSARTAKPASARYFEMHIAPLLSRHCIECHGGESRKGRLDLTSQEKTLEGGRSGKVIVPGNSQDSLLWELVRTDEMPSKRPPLAAEEKERLREWIDAGATWSVQTLAQSLPEGDEPVERHHEFECEEDGQVDPGPILLRRLTVPEYIATVKTAVGIDIARKAREILPADLRADGFSNTAYNLNVDLGHVEAYAELARIIVSRVDVDPFTSRHASCQNLSVRCLRELVSGMGKWLLRGPLQEHEVAAYLGIGTAVADAGGDFTEAASYILEAMLQSPRFVYRTERQRGQAETQRLGPHELAARMSYILWGAPPDRELMRAADAGELADPETVEKHVRRMLEDPRAVEQSKRFASEWLHLDRLNSLRPNPEHFPGWSDQLAADMRDETLAFFEQVVWKEKRPLVDLLNAELTFATPRLARHYGLEPRGDGWQRYDLSSVPGRGGLLTHGSVLTVGGDEASMVARGLFVLRDILSSGVDDPPPCVDTTPVPTEPGLSQRGIAEGRVADPACGGCHSRFEPLAFGLEKFDGVGAYHEKDEHGNKLRDDGEILFPRKDEPVAYDSAGEMMDLLAASERVRENLTLKLTQFALGRPLVKTDSCVLKEIHARAQEGGGTYASLITAIVLSDLVQTTRMENKS